MSYANREQGVPVIVISSSAIEGLNALATADLNTYLATLGALWTFNGGLDVGVSGSNRLVLRGGAGPTLTVDGTTDINLFISAKGTGTVQFYQSIKVDVLKANYIQISGEATGAKPSIQALGADADISITITPKGAGTFDISSSLNVGFNLVNYLQLSGAAASAEPSIQALGADADISITITPKGAGTFDISSSLNVGFNLVNYLQLSGAAASAEPSIQALGADADISITITPKGAGTFDIRSSLNVGFNLANYLQLSGSATGNALAINAIGTDANTSVDVFTKGAGLFTWKGDQLARTAYTTAISAITVGGSPFLYTNAGVTPAQVFITGGTVTEVAYSRDESTFYVIGSVAAQMVLLAPGDSVRVTYTAAPTMSLIPM